MGGDDYTSTYNSAGRLMAFNATNFTNATNPANLLVGAQYDAAGHLISATLANGLTESWKYDNRERMQAEAVGTNCTNGTCSGSTAYGFSLTFAPNGNVLTSNDTVNSNWTYVYDAFNRLACSNLTNNGTCASPTSGKPTFSYVYDRFGNRWQQNGPANFLATFSGSNNQMDLPFHYDAAGNLLNDQASPPNSYVYDAENRIVSVNSPATTYTYNPKGQRVAKTTGGVTTDFIYDRDGHVILTNPDNPTFIEMYVAGMHLGTYDVNTAQTASIFYYDHADWLGTERARTNLSGVACEKTTSFAFGDMQTVSFACGQPVSPRRFTGKERDSESGLDYFGARYYSSAMGRFASPDWSATPTGVPYANFGNPQSLNLYGYVKNDPLSFADPDGHCCWDWIHSQASDSAQVLVGEVKQIVNNGARNWGAKSDVLSPSNPLQQAGADFVKGPLATGVAIGAVFVGRGEGESPAPLPNDAFVVRGGSANPTGANSVEGIAAGTGTHPSGVTGFSVESAPGKSVEQLAGESPTTSRYGQIGCCTVGQVRDAGGDVVQTPGQSPNHATVTGLTPQQANQLLTPTIPNPAKVKTQ